jgi:hypothetical protein
MAKEIPNNTTTQTSGRSIKPSNNDDYIFLPNAKHREINGQIFLANDDHTFITPTRELLHAMVHHNESGDFPTVTEITGPVRFRHSPAPGGMVQIKGKPKR